MNDPAAPSRDGHQPTPTTSAPQRVKSQDLLGGNKEVLIEHAGETYRLRLTRNGKLILHK